MTKKLVLLLLALAFVSVFPLLLSAQEMGSNNSSVTGCLKQGTETGGYYLLAQDGKMYEILGHGVNLAEHVGHTITLTGHSAKLPEKQETKRETAEKGEAGNSSYSDFRATSVKMVSASCQ